MKLPTPYIAGDQYSLADCCWSVTVARQMMLKRSPLSNRPSVARWFTMMQRRPSYQAAGIMDHFSFRLLLKLLRNEFSR